MCFNVFFQYHTLMERSACGGHKKQISICQGKHWHEEIKMHLLLENKGFILSVFIL